MKKIIMSIIVIAMCSISAFSQNGPVKGSFGTEVQFNPFDQNGEMFKLDGLKFRYFLTDKDALRLKLGFAFGKQKLDSDDMSGYAKSGDFSIGLGYERHFRLLERLDLYAGGQIGYIRHFASAETEMQVMDETVTTEYKNMIPGDNGDPVDIAYNGLNLSAFTGLDFYVYKGLYIGTELGLYIDTNKTNEYEYHVSNQNPVKTDVTVRTTNIKFNIEPTIRLGWTF